MTHASSTRGIRGGRPPRGWLLWPALALLFAFFLLPSLDAARSSIFIPEFSLANFARFADRPIYLQVLQKTLAFSAIVAVLCMLLGYPAALYIAHQPRQRQFSLMFLLLLTLWMSVLIRSYAWVVVLGREGIVNVLLQAIGLIQTPAKLLYTSGAVLAATVQILLPLQIVTCVGAMAEIDTGLVKAARILGASHWQAFWRVYFPLSLQGVANAATLVFMLSMGFFITPALLGGRSDLLLANLVEQQVIQLQWGFAATLAVVLLGAAFVGFFMIRLLRHLVARLLGSRL